MAIYTSAKDSKSIVYGKDAVAQKEADKKASTAGKQVTDKGTLIRRSTDNNLDSSSFLKIMLAEMKNMDPSSNQDNTQYVTQMAQLSTMQQMTDLTKSMNGYSYQALIGKGVTVDVADSSGKLYTGIVKGVLKQRDGNWNLAMDVKEKGKVVTKEFDAKTLKYVIGTQDGTNSNILVNSDFMAASNLASNKDNKVIILATDTKGAQSIVKGTVKSTFLDNGQVKVRVAVFDSSGKEATTTTDYPYATIVKAGNLTDKDMDVKVEDYATNNSSTDTYDPTRDPNSKYYNKEAAMAGLDNSKTDVKGSNKADYSSNTIDDALKKVQDLQNG